MFFIAGITGNIGGAAAKMLLAEGKQVRAIVRVLQLTKERCRWGSSFSDTTWSRKMVFQKSETGFWTCRRQTFPDKIREELPVTRPEIHNSHSPL
jgi:hypothetical protein